MLISQPCLILCDPMDSSPSGSSVHGIFQARMPEWAAFSFSRGAPGLLHCRKILYHLSHREHLKLTIWYSNSIFGCISKKLYIYTHTHTHTYISDQIRSVQFSSVAQSCPTLCDPMNRSTPGLPVQLQLSEFTQTHVHRVSDAIQPSHPLSSPSPLAPNPSKHQGLFQWINSSHEVAKVLEFQL